MERTVEETRALAEAAQLRRVIDRLRSLAAATAAELEVGGARGSVERRQV